MERTVLIVDDNIEFCRLLERAFEIKGYKTIIAASAEEALDLLVEQPCLVMFIDLNLPGMSGVELCRKIKADYPFALCHAVTGYTSIYSLLECRVAGFDDFLVKPSKLSLLQQVADDAFKKLDRWMKQE